MRSKDTAGPIRVLVVDDHPVVRAGVRSLLSGASDVEVVGEAEDGHQAVEQAKRRTPNVILMDLRLPGLAGVEATRRILAKQREIGIVALTSPDAEPEILSAIEAGALGFLSKTSPKSDFLEAIRRVARGEAWLPPRLTRRLLSHFQPGAASVTMDALTPREHEVLEQVARGMSNREIAGKLCVAEITVRTHVAHILDKLGASNRVEAALHALQTGLVPLDALEPAARDGDRVARPA